MATEDSQHKPYTHPGAQPVGHGNYTVEDGDCLESIALDSGHFWKTLWNLPENADLKRIRKNPNVLLPGDQLVVPPIVPKEVPAETEIRHIFRRKGVPSTFRFQCLAADEPLASMPFRLDIDGVLVSGRTDNEGKIEQRIPPSARSIRLIVGRYPEEHEYNIALGRMNPIDTISGMKSRLNNLGFMSGAIDEEDTPNLRGALARFQRKHGLESNGDPDDATKSKLDELGG